MADTKLSALAAITVAAGTDLLYIVGASPGRKITIASLFASPTGVSHTISVGQTTSALTDLLINPTTKASGNLIQADVNSVNKFKVDFDGNVTATTFNSVKKYVALLTQTGTNAPVATVLENTLGGTVVWGRTNVGIYTATLSGAFTANKTVIFVSSTAADWSVVNPSRVDANSIKITTVAASVPDPPSDFGDDLLVGTPIEIRVYP